MRREVVSNLNVMTQPMQCVKLDSSMGKGQKALCMTPDSLNEAWNVYPELLMTACMPCIYYSNGISFLRNADAKCKYRGNLRYNFHLNPRH